MNIIEQSFVPGTLKQKIDYTAQTAARIKKGIKNGQVDKKSDLYRACIDFESIFIKQMLNVMRKTVNKSGFLNGGFAEEIFEDMLYDEYSKKMADNAQFGLAELIYRQISPSI